MHYKRWKKSGDPTVVKKTWSRNEKHGMSQLPDRPYPTPTYISWCAMKQRCNNPKSPRYKDYGGRGIKICKEWNNDFAQFYKDMGIRPPDHSIDRIDNDGDYTPDNCRWATKSQQIRNRRGARLSLLKSEHI